MSDSVVSKKRMKLFVVGEASSDPKKWSSQERLFVVAETAGDAERLTNFTSIISEIKMDHPVVFF
jgi:hypothetical protein